jgi:hypothetical protein
MGFYIPEDDILHSHRRENLKSQMLIPFLTSLFIDVELVQTTITARSVQGRAE